ncbi:hypothetical protein [Variovorax guangxiensis]|uniref:hypothetical protein n=1 Tax=Variovorax guangxiensis TaxID=1775474 RepID=UPI0028661109|nr:hypothetical protein [Variovorax guangxiensis]MDR6859837.1 hypothetical protein [Variovorax guangxiensis]
MKFKTTSTSVSGNVCDNTSCASLSASAYDDLLGVRQGNFYAQIFYFGFPAPPTQLVTCTGPTYANILAVDQKTWKATLNVTVSGSDPGCYSTSTVPITINLTGIPDGNYFDTHSGHGTVTATNGYKVNYKMQSDTITENFTGTNGFFTGNFQGSLQINRRTDLTLTK